MVNCQRFGNIEKLSRFFLNGQKNLPENHRPICMTSSICRGLESIINEKITGHILSNNLFPSNQHGFICNRSTLTQHLNFFNHLTKIQTNKLNSDIVYIDFSKAFDKISHSKLIYVLSHYKINSTIINWIKNYLHDRTQSTVVENKLSYPCAVTSGVPQGTVLAPLCLIYT